MGRLLKTVTNYREIRQTLFFSPLSFTLRPQNFGALYGPSDLSPLRSALKIYLCWGGDMVCLLVTSQKT